jgi:hypothetical protein
MRKNKLRLHRETLRRLSDPSLGRVFGGGLVPVEPTGYSYCLECGSLTTPGGETSVRYECTIQVTNCGCNME